MNEIYVLLSRNNVYIGIYNKEQFNAILENIEVYFYPIESLGNTCVYKTNDFNTTKIRNEIIKMFIKLQNNEVLYND